MNRLYLVITPAGCQEDTLQAGIRKFIKFGDTTEDDVARTRMEFKRTNPTVQIKFLDTGMTNGFAAEVSNRLNQELFYSLLKILRPFFVQLSCIFNFFRKSCNSRSSGTLYVERNTVHQPYQIHIKQISEKIRSWGLEEVLLPNQSGELSGWFVFKNAWILSSLFDAWVSRKLDNDQMKQQFLDILRKVVENAKDVEKEISTMQRENEG